MKQFITQLNNLDQFIQSKNINVVLFTIFSVSLLFLALEQNRIKEVETKVELNPTLYVPEGTSSINEVEHKDLSDVKIPDPIKKDELSELQKSKINNFIFTYKKLAKELSLESDIPASVILAQGMLESDFGTSILAQKSNNHFGIKKKKEKLTPKEKDLIEGYILHNTKEFRKGREVKEKHYFCKYKTPEDSFKHYVEFITKRRDGWGKYPAWKSYKRLQNIDRKDWKKWVNEMNETGYSTNPKYAENLEKVIVSYKLYRYD